MLSVSWPGPAVGAFSGPQLPERLDRWADGALHRWGWKGAASAGGLLKLTLKPTKRGGGPTDHCVLPEAPVLHRDDGRGLQDGYKVTIIGTFLPSTKQVHRNCGVSQPHP